MYNETLTERHEQGLIALTGSNKALYYCNEVESEVETEEGVQKEYCYDVYEVSDYTDPINSAKADKIREIEKYDSSACVNALFLNGKKITWSGDDASTPNKDVRMGLRQNIADKIALGEENITLWLGGRSITVRCEVADGLMRALENYAYECFNVTASHKAEVMSKTELEDILTYDCTTGYPERLRLTI